MENNLESTNRATGAAPSFAQGTSGANSNPFAKAAASGAARRMREQQKALKEAMNSSAKTVKE